MCNNVITKLHYHNITLMARPGITKEQVFETADEIRDEGGIPTITAVRDRLGKKGSYSTYSRYLQEWRDTQNPAPTPPPTPDSVSAIARRLWSEAWRLAAEELETEKQKWEKEKKLLRLELHNLAIELDHCKEALHESEQRERKALEQASKLQGMLDVLQGGKPETPGRKSS